jgi:hypothetical protein
LREKIQLPKSRIAAACCIIAAILFPSLGFDNQALADRDQSVDSASRDLFDDPAFRSSIMKVSDRQTMSADNVTTSALTNQVKAAGNAVVTSGSNRYLAWIDYTPGNADIMFRRSTDYGATWKPVVNLSLNPGHSINVVVVATGSNVYLAWEQYNLAYDRADVFFRASTDSGATWGSKINLSSSGKNVRVYPQLVASGSNVFAAWSESNDEILVRRSVNNGASWEPAVNLSNNSGPSTLPQLAISGSNVYVVWQDYTLAASNFDIMLRRSTNDGASWKPAVNLSANFGDSFLPRIAAIGSRVYVVWSDLTPGNYDVLFRRSTDNGATWKPFFNLSGFPGDSLNPQMSVTLTNVYVTWEQDNSPFTLSDIFVRASTDSGGTWGPKIKLSSSGDNKDASPQVAASGTSVYVSWSESRDEIFVRVSADNGAIWNDTLNLSKNNGISNTAYVAASGSSVSVVWTDYTPGNADILFKRSTDKGATWKSTFNISNNAGNSLLTESVPS